MKDAITAGDDWPEVIDEMHAWPAIRARVCILVDDDGLAELLLGKALE